MLSQKILDEYNMVKNNAGLLDFSMEGKIKVTGIGRVDFINNLTSNDIKNLKENDGIYAAFLDRFGKILSDCIIYKFKEFLLINLSIVGKNNIIKKLIEESKLAKSTVEDLTLKYALFSIQGKNSLKIISQAINNNLEFKQEHQCKLLNLGNNEFIVTKNNRCNNGYDIFVPAKLYSEFKKKMIGLGIMQISNDTYNVLRLESKIPLFGIDFNEKNIINEITEKAVSYKKGCFVGQEVVARIKSIAKGKTAKKLFYFEINANNAIGKNAKIMKNNNEAGYITSSAFSPELKKTVAFGFLYKDFYDYSDFEIAGQKITARKIEAG